MTNKLEIDRELAERIEHLLLDAFGRTQAGTELRALLAAPVVERQEPFMYGIMQPDGKPHYSELCVSGEPSDLESEVESMNDGEGSGYRVVALYAGQPAPVAVTLLREAYECGDRNVFGTILDDRIRVFLEAQP